MKAQVNRKIRLVGAVALVLASSIALADVVYIACRRCNGRGLLCSVCNNTGRRTCYVCNGRGGFNMPGPFGAPMWQICNSCEGGTRMCMDCVTTSVGCPDCGARGGIWVDR